jgi:hypothetical protein
MKPKFLKTMMITLAAVAIWSWVFGALRFEWEPANVIFSILNIPLGYPYLKLASYLWITYGPSHWINDEITEMLIWILFSICQSLFYVFLIRNFKIVKRKNI